MTDMADKADMTDATDIAGDTPHTVNRQGMKAGSRRSSGLSFGRSLTITILLYLAAIMLASALAVGMLAWSLFRLLGGSEGVTSLLDALFATWESAFTYSGDGGYWWMMALRASSLPILAVITLIVGTTASLIIIPRVITRRLRPVNQGLERLLDDDGRPIELPDDLHDIETQLNTVRIELERRRAETQTEQRRKNDLVMYLAHDIRTPLTSVIGYLSLLDEADDMPAGQRRKFTKVALDKAQRLDVLVDEFFDITRYNLTSISLRKNRMDLQCLLVQLTEEFYPLLEAHGNTLHLQAATGLWLDADADKLARVFNNLLKNAVSYSDRDSEITVDAGYMDTTADENGRANSRGNRRNADAGADASKEPAIRVRVSSHGPTIPSQQLNMLFDKFYRLDSARGTANGGAGLGLAIARQIVELHGGTITAASDNGVTTFCVTLPSR